jgi:hypothetical protein
MSHRAKPGESVGVPALAIVFFGQKQFLPETLCLKAYSRDAKPAFLVKDFLFLGTFFAKSCKNVPNSFAMSVILSV